MRKLVPILALLIAVAFAALPPPVSAAEVCPYTTSTVPNPYQTARVRNAQNLDAICDSLVDGVGAKNGASVAVSESGSAAVHKTVLTLTSTSITMTDAGAAGSHGGTKVYDFPAGVIIRGGCVANLTTLAGAGGIADGAAVVLALGLAAPATDNATLAGANEADFVASYAGTLTAGAGVFTKYGEPSATSLDGHTTAVDLFVNAAVPDADSSANDTLAVSGTITCLWSTSGDF